MRLVNCNFYAVGCHSPISYCKLEQHCLDYLHFPHAVYSSNIYKEASVNDLKSRGKKLEKVSLRVLAFHLPGSND